MGSIESGNSCRSNSVSAQLSPEDRDAILQAIQTIRPKLPFLIDLFPREAYVAALLVYNYGRSSGLTTGLDEVMDELGKRFARRSRASEQASS